MIRRILLVAFLQAAPVVAAEAERPAIKPAFNIDMLQWTGALIVVLAAIVTLAWLLRRVGRISGLEPGRFRVLAALSLGARERVVLVQLGEKQLVLGVAPGQVRALCILEAEEAIKAQGLGAQTGPEGAFAERLAALTAGKRP